jgi:hypothetical protein
MPAIKPKSRIVRGVSFTPEALRLALRRAAEQRRTLSAWLCHLIHRSDKDAKVYKARRGEMKDRTINDSHAPGGREAAAGAVHLSCPASAGPAAPLRHPGGELANEATR